MMPKRKGKREFRAKRRLEIEYETWLEQITKAIKKNTALARRLTVFTIVVLMLNPLLLLSLRHIFQPQLPETFCDDFVLDVDGSEQCMPDASNSALFLKELTVSGRNCQGSMNKHIFSAPFISVWASSSYDLSLPENYWYLITSPRQAGLNTLYPAKYPEWSWTVRSKFTTPKTSPMSAVSSMPGFINIVACLELNTNIFKRRRGQVLKNPDFREMCTNVATWCGSICNYASDVNSPTCNNSALQGADWQNYYQKTCVPIDRASFFETPDPPPSRTPSPPPPPLLPPQTPPRLRKDPIVANTVNETLVILGRGENATWTGGDNEYCVWRWVSDSTVEVEEPFSYSSMDGYDMFAVACVVLFDVLTILNIVPLLPSHPKNYHHGMYAKRMLDFQHGLHDQKVIDLLESGNIKSLVFITPRVTEGDFKAQMQSTCTTMLKFGEWLKDAGMQQPLKLIVCVVDEDRRTSAFNEPCLDPTTGQVYFKTELLSLIEECSRDPWCDWFPGSCPTIRTPPVGGHYRSYSKKLSDSIRMEFHYLRRGWRMERSRSLFERMLGFGEVSGIRVGDHVEYDNGPGEEHGLGYVKAIPLFGPVVIARERYFASEPALDDSDDDTDSNLAEEVQLPASKIRKLIQGGGKGAALTVAYDFLRASIGADAPSESPEDRGSMLTCILDARHHVKAQDRFWNALLGPWWREEMRSFDGDLRYVQVSQNLLAPQHYWLGQQNRMWYSFTSPLLGAVGMVTSSGSGSITRIPLDKDNFAAFRKKCLTMLSNTEDFLQSISLLLDGAAGAYVCDYSFTEAKCKDTMLSAFLRWEGGNFAVFPHRMIFVQACYGFLLLLLLFVLAIAPLAALVFFDAWQIAAAALGLNLGLTAAALLYLTVSRRAANVVRRIALHQVCLRSILNPWIGILGGMMLFSLPFISYHAGHLPLQLSGVAFPWTLLIRTLLVMILQGAVYTTLLVTDWLRNDAQRQVLAVKLDPSTAESSGSATPDSQLTPRTPPTPPTPTSSVSSGLTKMRCGSVKSSSQWLDEELACMIDPRDQVLDKSCTVHTAQVWAAASAEYLIQLVFQMNQLTLQPGKGLMSFTRGMIEIAARGVFGVDTSGWTSFKIERVVLGIPLFNEIFLAVFLYPYPTEVSAFFVFVIVTWFVRTLGFVWVEEFLALTVKNAQLKATLTLLIVAVHVFVWFAVADML